jgi:CBS domain-containing protein
MGHLTVRDVMTSDVVTVGPATAFREVVDVLTRHRVSAVPVVDAAGAVLGLVSESDLMAKIEFAGASGAAPPDSQARNRSRLKAGAATAAELMSAPVFTVSPATTVVAAAAMLESLGVKRLPVVGADHRLVGIVTRSDLLRVFLRSDAQLRAEVDRRLAEALPGSTPRVGVERGVVTLAGRVDGGEAARAAVRLARGVEGVVEVADRLTYDGR